jgi:copper chaperone CopZ
MLLFTLLPISNSSVLPGVDSVWAGQEQSIELPITGMTCAACGFAVKTVLKRLDGIHDAKVSYEKKSATVTYDLQQVTPEQMAEAVNATGTFGIDLQAVEKNP